jgi:hypothetical protein
MARAPEEQKLRLASCTFWSSIDGLLGEYGEFPDVGCSWICFLDLSCVFHPSSHCCLDLLDVPVRSSHRLTAVPCIFQNASRTRCEMSLVHPDFSNQQRYEEPCCIKWAFQDESCMSMVLWRGKDIPENEWAAKTHREASSVNILFGWHSGKYKGRLFWATVPTSIWWMRSPTAP